MRYVWTDAGDDPSYDVGDRHGINGYFWPMFDSLTTRENLTDCKNRGHAVGIYMAWNWPQFTGKTPKEVAAIMSEEYKRCFVPGLKVQYNDERHDPGAIMATLQEWRKLRPTINTSWTMEGMQGGWMSPTFVKAILDCRVRVVPQSYRGNMDRLESDATFRDLLKRGFPENVISCFYDAKQLGGNWDGFAFTMGRLP